MSKQYDIPIRIADVLIDLTSPLSAAELGIEERLGPFRMTDAREEGRRGKGEVRNSPFTIHPSDFPLEERSEKGEVRNSPFTIHTSDFPLARVALRWEESAGPPASQGDLIYDPGSIWKMYRTGTDFYASLAYQGEGQVAPTQGVIRANSAWDDLTLTEQRTGANWRSLLNLGAGELILRAAILFTGGLVFHSAGLDDNGKGIVFVGHAGAGKSTQLGWWLPEPGVIAMNDDRVAVRPNAAGAICYGTPWGGTANIARNHQAPLAALILLEQAPENDIQPLTPSAAASSLLARTFLPYWDRGLMLRAAANLNVLLARAPVYRLRCRAEPEVVPLVRSVLCSSPTAS
jgi:hypothetical protein